MNRKVITIETPHTQTTQNKDWLKKKKMNKEILKRIMFEKKTRLPRNQNWKTVKTEIEKINVYLVNVYSAGDNPKVLLGFEVIQYTLRNCCNNSFSVSPPSVLLNAHSDVSTLIIRSWIERNNFRLANWKFFTKISEFLGRKLSSIIRYNCI